MKKFLVLLLCAMMMFAFVACEPDTPEPGTEATTVLDLAFESAEEVEKLDNGKNSVSYDETAKAAKIDAIGAYYQLDIEDGASYEITYDVVLNKDTSGSIDFNHNFVKKDSISHFCQGYLVLETTEEGVTAKVKTEAGEPVKTLGTVTYEEETATIHVKAVYEKTADTNKVTVSVNDFEGYPNEKAGENDSIFWCLYTVNTSKGYIDNFKIVKK